MIHGKPFTAGGKTDLGPGKVGTHKGDGSKGTLAGDGKTRKNK